MTRYTVKVYPARAHAANRNRVRAEHGFRWRWLALLWAAWNATRTDARDVRVLNHQDGTTKRFQVRTALFRGRVHRLIAKR